MRNALYLLYAVSGVCSLAFEVLWARMLSVQFGVSIFGIVVTIAAFMGGLGAGSLLGRALARRLRSPLLLFALLETGIAAYALALPWLLATGEPRLLQLSEGASLQAWYGLQAVGLLALILLPATAMGAGFPLVLRAASGSGKEALGPLYGLNALGAAGGALLPLWLLPAFGWARAVEGVALLGFFVGAAAGAMALRSEFQARAGAATDELGGEAGVRPPLSALVAYAVIGAAAIMVQIAWTRLYGMVLLRTEYVMAIILAVYLLGIGGGSLLARFLGGGFWPRVFPILAAFLVMAGSWLLPIVARWAQGQHFSSLGAALAAEGAVLAVVTLPVTLLLGAWLPMLARHYGSEAWSGPLLYGINSVGAALGALVSGFVLIPVLGTPGMLALAAALLLLAGLAWARRPPLLLALLPAGAVVAWPVVSLPPAAALLRSLPAGTVDRFRYEDAMAITHVVEQPDGQRLLLSDLQRMDASTDQAAVELQKNQARLPLMLHPAAETVLFLGLGTGISAAGSLEFPGLQTRTGVELSRGAIEAAEAWFVPVNHGVLGGMHVHRDDARRFLATSRAQWDIIIGDVFHPDLVGRSSLLSVQQFERARRRLRPGGLFVQWLALNQLDRRSLEVVLRTFREVFPDAVMFMDGFRIAMVGGVPSGGEASGLRVPGAAVEREASEADGESLATWLGRYWGRIPVPPRGPVQDEWRPTIEFRLPRARYSGELALDDLMGWLLKVRPPMARAIAELGVAPAGRSAFEAAWTATDLALRSWLAALQDDAAQARRLLRFAWESNPDDRWVSLALADSVLAELAELSPAPEERRQILESLLKIRPDHAEALRALWHLERERGHTERAAAWFDRLAVASPLDSEVVAETGRRILD